MHGSDWPFTLTLIPSNFRSKQTDPPMLGDILFCIRRCMQSEISRNIILVRILKFLIIITLKLFSQCPAIVGTGHDLLMPQVIKQGAHDKAPANNISCAEIPVSEMITSSLCQTFKLSALLVASPEGLFMKLSQQREVEILIRYLITNFRLADSGKFTT